MGLREHKAKLEKLQSLIALFSMIVFFSVLYKDFRTLDNFWTIMRQVSVNACLSVGMTMVILTGGIDLSVGSVLALSGAFAAGLLKNGLEIPALNLFVGVTVLGSVVIAGLVGSSLGLFNGLMITRFKIPPFVATLCMLIIARGFTELWTGGANITGLGTTFDFLGTGRLLGVIPMPVCISTVAVFIAAVVLKKTRFGRYIYAVGGNERAARLSGLNVNRIKTLVYTISGFLAAIGGIIVTAKIDSASPTAGEAYELDSIAAVVIGGTSLDGGRGSVLGTVIGVLIIGILNSGLTIAGVDPFWQKVVKGFVILLAVVIDRLQARE